jgi:hypothetical protein
MTIGKALHIGVNFVDAAHYGSKFGILKGCHNDANDMAAITKSRGFTAAPPLLGAKATVGAVVAQIKDAAAKLKSGDIFVLTFSGHGFQVPDLNGDEPDGLDEVWALFDKGLVDDELYGVLASFRPGVKVLVISDSCHSGSVVMLSVRGRVSAAEAVLGELGELDLDLRAKVLPDEVAAATFENNVQYYSDIQRAFPAGRTIALNASVLSLSACKDNQVALDGPLNGYFTGRLKDVWANGNFSGTYRSFYSAILKLMPYSESPTYFLVGAANPSFEASQPFSI